MPRRSLRSTQPLSSRQRGSSSKIGTERTCSANSDLHARRAAGPDNKREHLTSKQRGFALAVAWGLSLLGGVDAAVAQSSTSDATVAGDFDASSAGKIGRVHDNLRRAADRHWLYAETADVYNDYLAFKARIGKATGFSWSMDLSYLQQWGRLDGGSPAGQVLATPSIDWTLFENAGVGAGSVQLAYILTRYGTDQSAADVQSNLGLITPVNDYPARQSTFSQLTYTHALSGNRLLLSVGQYPISNFDGNPYLANQQQNFNNYVLTQNGSATYAFAGLGAYVQVNATKTLQFAAGLQNASSTTGTTLSTKGFGDYGYSWFGYAQWTPAFRGLGSAQYSITYYEVPTVPAQPRSTGWSVNASQNLDTTWAVFGRANRAYGYVTPIRASYALGAAINNPLGRRPTDQIGLAFGFSDAAPPPSNPAGARDEKVIEAYWNWSLPMGLLLTPDVQYIHDRALSPTRAYAWVLSLRATLMF